MLKRFRSTVKEVLLWALAKLPLRPDLAVEFPASYSDLLDVILRSSSSKHGRKRLIALVLANPEHRFVKDNILPMLEEWHFRSGEAVVFAFFGYKSPPFSATANGNVVRATPEFSAHLYVEALVTLEAATAIQYTGRTMLVLTAAELTNSHVRLDYEWVLDFDIEGLVKAGAIDDVRVLFEQIVRLAKRHPADDALWAIRDDLSDDMKHEAVMNIAQSYIPFLQKSREVANAHTTFRVRDRRQKQSP